MLPPAGLYMPVADSPTQVVDPAATALLTAPPLWLIVPVWVVLTPAIVMFPAPLLFSVPPVILKVPVAPSRPTANQLPQLIVPPGCRLSVPVAPTTSPTHISAPVVVNVPVPPIVNVAVGFAMPVRPEATRTPFWPAPVCVVFPDRIVEVPALK